MVDCLRFCCKFNEEIVSFCVYNSDAERDWAKTETDFYMDREI